MTFIEALLFVELKKAQGSCECRDAARSLCRRNWHFPRASHGDRGARRGRGFQPAAFLGCISVCMGTEAPGGVRGGPCLQGHIQKPSPCVGLRLPGRRVSLASVFVCLSIAPLNSQPAPGF